MVITKIHAAFFSATGNTRKITAAIAAAAAAALDCPLEETDLTLPAARQRDWAFAPTDLVILGTPTYAGRVPNKLEPFLAEHLRGNGALCAAVVTYGNRSFDNALSELCAILEGDGFHTVSAGAFACRHAFTDELAWGRPDRNDLADCALLGQMTAEKAEALTAIPTPIRVPGEPDAPYYIPKGTDGLPAKFLKAKPVTDPRKCCNCGLCARICPMGAIDASNVFETPGVCIKCQACVRRCTRQAKRFEDPAFLSHVAMLEANFQDPKQNEVFF